MDISELYIKMCDCPEIQGLWEPKDGDCFVAKEDYQQVEGDDWPVVDIKVGSINVIHNAWRMDDMRTDPRLKGIWLPDQDDLDGMVSKMWSRLLLLLLEFAGYDDTAKEFSYSEFTSMKQLKLAFVMHELHGKIWDGSKWGKNV